MEDLLVAHRSAPRNKLIADTLYKTDLLESWGRGIDLMRNECRRVNQPEPEFVNEYSFFVVYFRYNRPLTTIVITGVSDQVKRLVNILGDTQLSLKAITDALNLKSSANVRRKYINPALEGGFIARIIPDSPNAPNQKYYLTDKGHALLSRLNTE